MNGFCLFHSHLLIAIPRFPLFGIPIWDPHISHSHFLGRSGIEPLPSEPTISFKRANH